jgi:hypothetical protein
MSASESALSTATGARAGRRDLWIALGLFAFALLVRLALLAIVPFDGLYGQDAYAYYDYAWDLAGALSEGQPPPGFFWPLGYPLHIVFTALFAGWGTAAGQLASLIAGALAVALTFALGREAAGREEVGRARQVGLIAALVVALGGQSLLSSVSTMADTTGLAWATLSAWLVLRYARNLRPLTLGLAGLTLAVAVVTRWGNALLVLPWALATVLAWRYSGRADSRPPWRQLLAGAVLAVLAGGLVVGGQLALGSHTGDLEVYSWDPLNTLRRDVTNPDGTFHYALPMALFYAQPLVHPSYVFPLLAPFWLAGLWSSRRIARPAAALLAGWPLALYLFLAGVSWQNPRFALSFLPPLAVWVGLGFASLWVAQPPAQTARLWRPAISALLLAGLIASGAWGLRTVANFVAQSKDRPLAQAAYLEGQVPPGSTVFTFGLTATLQHYTDLNVVELFAESPATLRAQVCGSPAPVYAYLDLASITGQWQGRASEVNYRYLHEIATLSAVGASEGYTLFALEPRCG